MKVLMLSFDRTLLEGKVGDSLERVRHYSFYLEKIVILVPNYVKNIDLKISNKIEIIAFPGTILERVCKLLDLCLKIIDREKITLIVAHDPILGFIGIVARILRPQVKVNVNIFSFRATNIHWLKENPIKNFFYSLAQIITVWLCDSIRVDGTKALVDLKKIGVKQEKVAVIPIVPAKESIGRFIAVNQSAVKKLRDKYLNRNERLILSIGSLIPQKNFPGLIEAFCLAQKSITGLKLLIIGKGPEKEKIESIITKLRLRNSVVIIDEVEYKDISVYYHAADLFVLNSLYEGFPRVLMEAAFSKIPIVTTDVGGASDLIINDFSGRVVPVNSSVDMAEAMVKMLDDLTRSRELARRCYKRAIKYCDFSSNLEKLMDLWKKTESQI